VTPIGHVECRTPPLAGRLRRLLEETADALGAAEATLWTLSDDGAYVLATLNHGPTRAIVESQAVPTDESVVGVVATQGISLIVGPDDWQNPAVMQATGTRVTDMVAVPVRCAGEIVGTLSLINPAGDRRFGETDLATAEWRAFLIAAVLTKAASES
jgi:GAF domain-containing protein